DRLLAAILGQAVRGFAVRCLQEKARSAVADRRAFVEGANLAVEQAAEEEQRRRAALLTRGRLRQLHGPAQIVGGEIGLALGGLLEESLPLLFADAAIAIGVEQGEPLAGELAGPVVGGALGPIEVGRGQNAVAVTVEAVEEVGGTGELGARDPPVAVLVVAGGQPGPAVATFAGGEPPLAPPPLRAGCQRPAPPP